MKTTYTDFWNCFLVMQPDLLVACKEMDLKTLQFLLGKLNAHTTLMELGLPLNIFYSNEDTKVNLQFITRGIKEKKNAATQLIEEAPKLKTWEYQAGIPPYPNHKVPMSLYFSTIEENVHTDQVFVAIDNYYKTSKKIHLLVFTQMNRVRVPKNLIKPFATDFLIHFLGEDLFYSSISRIKIVRRKPKGQRFLPLRNLKTRIEFLTHN